MDWLDNFIKEQSLPSSYADLAHNFFVPFAEQLVESIQQHSAAGKTFVMGVNGAQGTGKTTFAKLLSCYLTTCHGLNGSHISLDDFYLTRAHRQQRANEIHPLFLTRGVPGTHDAELAISVLKKLKTLKNGEQMTLPSFDKAKDDRKPKDNWPLARGAQDFVIFEGWCVGSNSVKTSELVTPINRLELVKDPRGIWRRAVNQYLELDYQKLFSLIDNLIFLKAPNFAAVLDWRREQEEKLRMASHAEKTQVMSHDEVAQFIQYFERITRANLETLPDIADTIFEFDSAHQIVGRV